MLSGRVATPRSAAPLRIGIVVGGPADRHGVPLHCGVRDYAVCLGAALGEAGHDACVMAPQSWSAKDGTAFIRWLRAERFDVLHLQYPSIGHRRSLCPHILGQVGAAGRFVVTLHEHSALPRIQRAANALFRLTADLMVFTTDFEARAFGSSRRSRVIPIGSNVPVHPGQPARDGTVLHFGQIRPGKGLEAFIDLARLSAASGEPGRFIVMGSAPPRWRGYQETLRSVAPASLEWIDQATSAAVAEAMATAMVAYLSFPDGAGFRRGSLLAALSNGLPVIAPLGPSTPDELRPVLFAAAGPAEALAQLRTLRADPALCRAHSEAGRALSQRFSWASIAEQHVDLYSGLSPASSPAHHDPRTLADMRPAT